VRASDEAGGDVFAALADPTRRQLLDRLSAEGPMSATDLARDYPVSRQAVVKHLNTLTGAGLLHPQRHGKEVLYGVDPTRLSEVSVWLKEVGDQWDRRLDALRAQLGGRSSIR
jgi:DNA-binding transcriptional ArsR family regulator